MENKQSAVKVPKKAQPKGGSRKGRPNKINKELKDMVLGALSDAGGQKYLSQQAIENPGAFMSLVGKLLPKEIKADVDMKSESVVSHSLAFLDTVQSKLDAIRSKQA